MVPILMPCSCANLIKSGRRAIVPSSLSTSQITEAGSSPASCARSQPASVCPARTSTPPSRATIGKVWPGITKSDGLALRATAACTVRDRSCAEMPVVTPSAASIDIVNAVPFGLVLWCAICISPNWCARASVMVRQTRPRACVTMKLIASGVTWSAARMMSPSFSRSSSSTSTTMRPARISSTISSTDAMADDSLCDM